jgi:hypothetical protein
MLAPASPSPNKQNGSTSLLTCCKPEEEKKQLEKEDFPQSCPALRYFVQHPIITGLEMATCSACILQLLIEKIMSGPGCDLSTLAATNITATIPVLLISAAAYAGGTVIQKSDTNWLIRSSEGWTKGVIEHRLLESSDEGFSVLRQSSAEVFRAARPSDAPPTGQFLKNAIKNPIMMGAEAFVAGILIELLLWPTILDSFNCFTGNSPVGSKAMMSGLVAGLIGIVVLYGIGAHVWSTERNELVKWAVGDRVILFTPLDTPLDTPLETPLDSDGENLRERSNS